jgi:hypothetical protein
MKFLLIFDAKFAYDFIVVNCAQMLTNYLANVTEIQVYFAFFTCIYLQGARHVGTSKGTIVYVELPISSRIDIIILYFYLKCVEYIYSKK